MAPMTPRKEAVFPLLPCLVLVVLALVLGGFYRLPGLDRRIMHTDEAVLGVKLADYVNTGHFEYDRKDYHGPGLHQVARLWGGLTGWGDSNSWTDAELRRVTVICGLLVLVLTLGFADVLGRMGTALALLLAAVSPMMVYYSRYFIMEMLLVLLVGVMLLAFWRYSQGGSRFWLLLGGASLGFQHATKETFILNFGAVFCGWVAVRLLFGGFSPRKGTGLSLAGVRAKDRPTRPWLWALGVAVLVSVASYSGGFRDWGTVWDSLMAYFDYFQRGQGSGHEKPWHYYLTLVFWRRDTLVWSEAMIGGLALLGMGHAFFGQHRRPERQVFLVFLTVYAVALFGVYSLIRYKTPWSILSAQHALILLAGAGGAALWSWLPGLLTRGAFHVLIALGAYHLCSQTMRLTGTHANPQFEYSADPRNPYVYSHTSKSLRRLLDEVRVYVGDKTETTRIQVVQADSGWPLPWYWRAWPKVGYHTHVPERLEAEIIVTDGEFHQAVADKLRMEDYDVRSPYGLRPGVMLSVFYRRQSPASPVPTPVPELPAPIQPGGTLTVPPAFSPTLPPLPGVPPP